MAGMNGKYDILVVGGGIGGYSAALRAAQLGMKTAVVEKGTLGGECAGWGCISTTALLESARLLDQIKNAAALGIKAAAPKADWKAMQKHALDAGKKMSGGMESLLKKRKIDLIKGEVSFRKPTEVSVKSGKAAAKTMQARHVIIAVGASPAGLPKLEFDGKKVLDPYNALAQSAIPKSVLVVGGGVVGVQFAYLFAMLGVKVTLAESGKTILPVWDREVSDAVAATLKRVGVTIKTGSPVVRSGASFKVGRGDKAASSSADVCVVAAGRKPNLKGLNLDKLGLELQDGFIGVNRYMRTNLPDLFAIGDVTGAPFTAHAAAYQGQVAAETIANVPNAGFDATNMPGVLNIHPPASTVGLTEAQAKAAGHDIRIGRADLTGNGFALAAGQTGGFVKFIIGKKYHEVLGVHIVGMSAPELIAEAVLGRAIDISAREFASTVHAHPTLSEAVMQAAAMAMGE